MSVLTTSRRLFGGSSFTGGAPAATAPAPVDAEQLQTAVSALGDGAATLTVEDHRHRAVTTGLSVTVISDTPPLVLTAVREDEPALGLLLLHRRFTLTLGATVLQCELHDTGDGGQRVVVIGHVTGITPA